MSSLKFYNNSDLKELTKKQFFSGLIPRNLSKENQWLANKIAHWFEYYGDYFRDLESKYDHIQSQFLLIIIISAVEAVIGTATFRTKNGQAKNMIYLFYENNLTPDEIRDLTTLRYEKMPHYSLKWLISQLYEKRNDLVHRAELPNLSTGSVLAIIRKSQRKGRKRGLFFMHFSVGKLYGLTKIAISRYIQKKPINRKPKQDLRLWEKRLKNN